MIENTGGDKKGMRRNCSIAQVNLKEAVMMRTDYPSRCIFGVLVIVILLFAGCGGGGGGGGSSSGGGGGGGTSAGTLDSSFGNSGLVVNAGEFAGSGFAMGTSITTDVMGRILVAGASYDSSLKSDMTLWRYDTDGQPDTSFGNYGIVVNDGAAGGYDNDAGLSITTDLLGRILVAGWSSNGSDDDMVIWRYDANGALDTSFGSSGVVVSDGAAGGSNSNDSADSITTDPDGKILVAGWSSNGSDDDMVIWRYESSGQLDTAFGGSGIVVHDSAAGGNGNDVGESITINSKGRILVTGFSSNGSDNDMVIWEYNSDGTLNSSFGTGGVVVSDNAAGGGGNDIGKSITTDSQRRILVTGVSFNGSDNDMVLWRYNPDGTPDTTFGSNGVVVVNDAAGGNGDDYGSSVTIDSQGRILVAGSSFNGSDYDMVIWRFNPDGTLDGTFGNNGVAIEDGATGVNSQDLGYSISTDSQGRILVTGVSSNGTDQYMVIWRYLP